MRKHLILTLITAALTLMLPLRAEGARTPSSRPAEISLQSDSTSRFAPLDSLLTQFYDALVTAPVEEKNAEFDALIASCTDSLLRQHVTFEIFNHYR